MSEKRPDSVGDALVADNLGSAVEGEDSKLIYNQDAAPVARLAQVPLLVPVPIPHPEEWQPKASFHDIADDDDVDFMYFKPSQISQPKSDFKYLDLGGNDPNVPHQLPTQAYMMAMREASLSAQQNDQWNPVQAGAPPPWIWDGHIPSWTQWESDKKVAEAEAASIDPSTLSSLIAGRNLEITHLHQDVTLAVGHRPPELDKELYRLSSAYEPLKYQELLKKYQRFDPPIGVTQTDVGSEYTTE